MVEIHLYGKLRDYSQQPDCNHNCTIMLEPNTGETIAKLLRRLGVPLEEINHIFYNAKLLASRAKAATHMGYEQVDASLSDWNLDIPVNTGDRIGLFGSDMAMLSM